jgi:hypothetical protein
VQSHETIPLNAANVLSFMARNVPGNGVGHMPQGNQVCEIKFTNFLCNTVLAN